MREDMATLPDGVIPVACRECRGKGQMLTSVDKEKMLGLEELRCGQCNGWGTVWKNADEPAGTEDAEAVRG